MGFRRHVVIAIFGFSTACHAQIDEVLVSLRSTAVVAGRKIKLSEIADVSANDPVLERQLMQLDVATLKALKQSTILAREEIEPIVQRSIGAPQVTVAWGGNRAVSIRPATRRIDISEETNRVAAWLIGAISTEGSGLALALIDDGGPIEVPYGRLIVHAEMTQAHRKALMIEVPVSVIVDNEIISKPTLRFSLQRVTSSPISAEGRSSASESVGGNFLEPTKGGVAIKKDQLVTILIDSGSVKIESQGIALADARVGQPVRVRRTGNGSVMNGQAGSDATVLVLGETR